MTNQIVCKICQSPTNLVYQDLFDDRYGYPGKFAVYQCVKCGFAQTTPELSTEQLNTLYTNYYPRKSITVNSVKNGIEYHPGKFAAFKRWLKGTNNTCHYYVKPNTKVLDVGCGNGVSLLEIKAQNAEAFGTELDRNVEPVAKELGLNIHFGSFDTANYPDNFFDVITMSQLLEHTPDPIAFLKLARKKLTTNGLLIMSFPNINSANRLHSGEKWINWHIPYHLNFFSRESLKLLAEQTGYRIDSIQTITPNVWIQLQEQASNYKAQVGKSSPVWQPLSTTNKEQSLWQRRWKFGKAIIKSYLLIPYLRWQDTKGQGDSFLIQFFKNS